MPRDGAAHRAKGSTHVGDRAVACSARSRQPGRYVPWAEYTEVITADERLYVGGSSSGTAPALFYDGELRDVAGRAAHSEVPVADLDGTLVGTATYVPPAGPLAEVDDQEAATIRMLGVAPAARGRGVGEALVRACIERARANGLRRIRLDTRTSMTNAQRLYTRLGFRRDTPHDWSPIADMQLLAYVLEVEPDAP